MLRARLQRSCVHSPRVGCILLSIASGRPNRASKELFAPEVDQVLLLLGMCMLLPRELSELDNVAWDGGRVKGRNGALCRSV